MLARVAVAPDSVCEPVVHAGYAQMQHAATIDAINAFGFLFFSSGDDARRFVRLIQQAANFPPGIAQKWATAVAELHKLGRVKVLEPSPGVTLSSFKDIEDFAAALSGRVEVAIFDQNSAAALGVSEHDAIVDYAESSLEISRLLALPGTRTFSTYREFAETGFVAFESPRDRFWNDILCPIARSSKTATIVDSYLFQELWRREQRLPRSRQLDAEHVVWLLSKLDRTMPRGSRVELMSVVDDDAVRSNKAQATARLLRDFWRRPAGAGRLREVHVVIASSRRRFPHDRHIRFGSGAAITFDAGLDRLRAPKIWDPSGMAWGFKWRPQALEPLRQREAHIRGLASIELSQID